MDPTAWPPERSGAVRAVGADAGLHDELGNIDLAVAYSALLNDAVADVASIVNFVMISRWWSRGSACRGRLDGMPELVDQVWPA